MRQIRANFIKVIAGIIMPVFLSALVPQIAVAHSADFEQIIFSLSGESRAAGVFDRYGIKASKLFVNSDRKLSQTYKAQVSPQTLDLMRHDPAIVYAEPDLLVKDFTVMTTDPFFTIDTTQIDKQWYLPKTHVTEAWDYTKGSANVTVAIIDTGIHASHIELNDGRVIAGFNIVTNQPILANADSDDNGHGTAVAGVIGAIPNNSLGIAGINWNVKLMPIKALAADGTGDISAVAAGIVWATDNGANIINMSLGGPGFGATATLSNAISYAFNHRVLVVSAAGNDLADQGLNLDASPIYPVCADNGANMVLGVAATDINDQKASFSNFGVACIDVSAPGKKILTTGYLPSNPGNNVLIYGSGTSLATPIVSGIAALIKATNPNLSNADIQKLIVKTADDIYPLNQTSCFGGSCNGFLGGGRINALSAVKAASIVVTPPPINGSLIREATTGNIYIIAGGVKRLVSTFVLTQRSLNPNSIISEINNQLASLPTGAPLPPLDGTLIKSANDPEVYIINQELKRPLTYLVFISRGLNFANIQTLSDAEVIAYLAGDWYWPPDATLVLIKGNPLVYVMDQQVARPITHTVFIQRHLSFSKVIAVTADEFIHVPRPQDQYWEPPLEGTLVKSAIDSGIYVIENRTKELLSYQMFVARGYNFKNVKTLPQTEMDVIAPGPPLL